MKSLLSKIFSANYINPETTIASNSNSNVKDQLETIFAYIVKFLEINHIPSTVEYKIIQDNGDIHLFEIVLDDFLYNEEYIQSLLEKHAKTVLVNVKVSVASLDNFF